MHRDQPTWWAHHSLGLDDVQHGGKISAEHPGPGQSALSNNIVSLLVMDNAWKHFVTPMRADTSVLRLSG
jgi:hypothetical protein